MALFDTAAVAHHHARAMTRFAAHDFIWQRMAATLRERLLDIRRPFAKAVEIAPFPLVLTPAIATEKKIEILRTFSPDYTQTLLPLEPESQDLIISFNHAQWVENLPEYFVQLRHALKPDGVLVWGMIGGATLQELRQALVQAETEIYGGISPRVSPFVALPDLAALAQATGLALPVVDQETWQVTYSDLAALVRDIRGMGQSNAVAARRRQVLKKEFWPRVEQHYRTHYGLADGRLPVTVEALYGLGWAPHPTQPAPRPRGSATVSLANILKASD